MFSKTIHPKSSNDINGLIHYFYYNKHNNFGEIVSITAIDTYDEGYQWSGPEVLIDPTRTNQTNSDNWCSSDTKEPSYFILSFKYYIKINSYSFKTRHTNTLNDYPTDWEVYGSIDNETWALIDSQAGVTELGVVNGIYNTQPNAFGLFKFFKFVLIKNNRNNYFFCLNKVDIFGTYFVFKTFSLNKIHLSLFSLLFVIL